MYRSVLVPLDSSPFAEQALPFALSIARRLAATLQVVMVGSHRADARCEYLEHVVERIRHVDGVPALSVQHHFLIGDEIAPTIRMYAELAGVDLVIMTTHGRGTLGRLLLGSVGYELMDHLPVPLLLLRPSEEVTEWAAEPVLKHILVILDGSSATERILEASVAVGRLADAEYTLVRFINNIPQGATELDSISLSSAAPELLDEIQSVRERQQKEAQAYLAGVADAWRVKDTAFIHA